MKKFISMVMAAAMVVSLVPATAFAATGTASFDVAGAQEWTEKTVPTGDAKLEGTQIHLTVEDINGKAGEADTYKIALDFDGAELKGPSGDFSWVATEIGKAGVSVTRTNHAGTVQKVEVASVTGSAFEEGDTSLELKIVENATNDIRVGDVIVITLDYDFIMSSKAEGTVATVTVSGDFGESEALTVGAVVAEGMSITVAGKPVEVAEEDQVNLKKVTIKSNVGDFPVNTVISLKLNKGFEFVGTTTGTTSDGKATFAPDPSDERELEITVNTATQEIWFNTDVLSIEAVSAEAGEVATLTVKASGYEGDTDEAAKVIADAVIMSVDEDEDVPVMYSGTNKGEAGLTSKNSHKSLKVTIEESVVGAWDTVKAWTLSLPEGVYVVDDTDLTKFDDKTPNGGVAVQKHNGTADLAGMFAQAYINGDYENFEFGRRAFKDSNVANSEKVKFEFTLGLVAEPEFEGPVTLTLSGDGFEGEAEVVIAEFVKAYTVEAAQNDLVIDYKETLVPTDVVVKEAEEGLWSEVATQAKFTLGMEAIDVEDAEITVDEDSEMELTAKKVADKTATFTVKEESDEGAASVTVSDIKLYMQRSIPAGAYDLTLFTSMGDGFMNETVFAAADASDEVAVVYYGKEAGSHYVETVKEGFVNVITAGRDKDDASFTKKVVVPVGEAYIIAGEETVALDVPAYINAAGYTMLPVRAVATALGINNNNVLWSQAAKQVTILYGQRIITMTAGQSVIYVNGSAIPAAAAVEIVDGRAFLALRDLANALGVTEIAYDAATKTATLN